MGNGHTTIDAHGVKKRVFMPSRVDTWTYCCGLILLDVPGMDAFVIGLPNVESLIC
jgi:hypothetical protein